VRLLRHAIHLLGVGKKPVFTGKPWFRVGHPVCASPSSFLVYAQKPEAMNAPSGPDEMSPAGGRVACTGWAAESEAGRLWDMSRDRPVPGEHQGALRSQADGVEAAVGRSAESGRQPQDSCGATASSAAARDSSLLSIVPSDAYSEPSG